jgi:NAD(P)H dehydrogenase (quinone)
MAKYTRILIVLANPLSPEKRLNFTTDLCRTFVETILKENVVVDLIDLYRDFETKDFSPVYYPGEKDSQAANYQVRIQRAEVVVFFHPVWLGTVPAMMKGFVEKVFTAGFAYKTTKNRDHSLLDEKKALVIATGEEPQWKQNLYFGNSLSYFWQRAVGKLSGMKTKVMYLGDLGTFTQKKSDILKQKIVKIAQRLNAKESLLDYI